MKLDYSVEEKTHRNYWLYKWLKCRCKKFKKNHRHLCIIGEPIYPVYQCPHCRYWWNNMLKDVNVDLIDINQVSK